MIENEWIVERRSGATARLIPLGAVHLIGPHLVNDVMAAAAVGVVAGAAPAAMTAAVDAFHGLEHAMELVAEVDGVRFVNDSKATNVESALRSIESFDRGLVPIIGGRFKGGDLGLLRGPLGARATAVVAIGEARPLVRGALAGAVEVTTPGRSKKPWRWPTRWHGRPAWCCWRRLARASTCFRTTRNADALQGGGGTDRGRRGPGGPRSVETARRER